MRYIRGMKRHITRQILMERLSPDALSYLFPGWYPDEPETGCPEPELPMPCEACFDLAYEAEEEERRPMFSIRGAAKKMSLEPRVPKENPDELDPRTAALLREIERIQKEFGVSIEELEVLLGYTVTLSPMHITRSGKLILVDFDEVEVKMDNVSKALYFLYLKHPEGITFKEVGDHREELLSIYRSICGRDDPAEIEKSIDHLVNPLGNALNVAASRIKIAFRNVVSDRVARFYYINGSAREAKKVPLDRDLVLWDY